MKLILDEGVPKQLALYLPGHETITVQASGWASVKNGQLLDLIEVNRFDTFLTCDKNMQFQQAAFAGRPFAVLVLTTNHPPTILPNSERIIEALNQAYSGTITTVNVGRFFASKASD